MAMSTYYRKGQPELEKGEVNKTAIWEASMKARLAVEFVEQTHAHEIYDRLGDGAKPTGNVNLWEKKRTKARWLPREL